MALVARAFVAVRVDLVAGPDPLGHVAAAAVGGVDDRADAGAGHDFVGRPARVPLAGHDPQIAGNRHVFPVVDHPEAGAVDVGGLPQFLGDPQVVEAVARSGAIDPDQFVGVVAVPDAVRERHAERRAPQQVGDEGDLLAVPGVEERTTALEHLLLDDRHVLARVQAILGYAVGPDDADQIGLPAVSEPDVGDRPVDFEVLRRPARLDLDRRAAPEDVVLLVPQVEAHEPDAQPVVLRAFQVLDPVEPGGAGHHEVQVAVVVEVLGPHGREACVARHPRDPREPEVEGLRTGVGRLGKHPQLSVGDQGEVAAAVVVRVEEGQVGSAFRQRRRTGSEGEGSENPVLISPEDGRRVPGEQELRNPVAVEVGGSNDPHRRFRVQWARRWFVGADQADQPPEQAGVGSGRGSLREPALAQVVEPQDARVVGQQQVRVAVAVGVGGLEVVEVPGLDFGQRPFAQGLERALEEAFTRHVAQQIGPAAGSRHREVEIAVAVEVDQVGGGDGQRAGQEAVALVGEPWRDAFLVDLPDGQGIADRDEVEAPVVVRVAGDQDPCAGFGGGARCRVARGGPSQFQPCDR